MDLFAFIRMRILPRCEFVRGRLRRDRFRCWNPLRVVLFLLLMVMTRETRMTTLRMLGLMTLMRKAVMLSWGIRPKSVIVFQNEEVNNVVDEELQDTAADKPEGKKKRRRAAGANGSDYPLKKLRENDGTFGDTNVPATATIPFVISFVTLTLEHEGGGNTDFISGPNLHTHRPSERFVISSEPSHHSSRNAADAEVTSLVRSPVPPPPMMTAAVSTTAIAGATSAQVLREGTEPVQHSRFVDSASTGAGGSDTTGPSNIPVRSFLLTLFIFLKRWTPRLTGRYMFVNGTMDYDQLFAEFNIGAACQMCLSSEVRLRAEHNFKERKKFERKCNRHVDLQVFVVEATKAAQISELDSLKKRNLALEGENNTLEGQVATIESAAATKDAELASLNSQVVKHKYAVSSLMDTTYWMSEQLTHDLSSLQVSCDVLGIRTDSFESQKDNLTDQVSFLETAFFGLRDQVSGYKLFKEQCEALQDEHVKVLSDHVAELDSELMAMALHLDEDVYPRFLTTITGLAIGKAMQTGLVVGVDHGKAERGLTDIAAYDPSMKAKRTPVLRIIMSLVHMDDPSAETLEVSRLQPSYEQLLLPIHQKEDNVVTEETSLSNSLDVVHARVQKVKECALSRHSSISDVVGVLVDQFSSANLLGEASTSGVPMTAATTTALSIPATTTNVSSVLPISVVDYGYSPGIELARPLTYMS
uniref:Transposase (Putative), gypsy type n=1 Tax=Tanacetum cinerariifolium TaxID=118510 RepID=A0A6L2J256_TANCI|nr:hypothetical protein [Tanacetum cinerariifolium]